MLTLMLQNILIALCMIFATELIITKQFPYTGSFVSDMNRTIPIKEVIQSLLSSSLFIKYINWCMCFFWRLYIIISTCYHPNPYPVFQKGGLSNMVQGLFLIFTDDRGAVPRQKDKVWSIHLKIFFFGPKHVSYTKWGALGPILASLPFWAQGGF